ncbi:histidine kinase [Paenibacillus sp. J31TS4]|uniref:GAF domain-containing sensor histidine kinase n=1 Tax=Paenibacillus sp. J31TS4 TaxID=2807195 RepID=UPI001B23C36A|nr:GAF domain-containing sensor histidine kinase [Paenibacillus sp. J31TS4]GIP38401.1 histidine kinase [Paenibacillus sp. J31TS4]
MTAESRIQELIILKTIAETLNRSNELIPMLNIVLDKLLDATGFQAAWIFLDTGTGTPSFAAATRLPPALEREECLPMRCGACWCLNRYRDGRLENAVNILSCKRLEDALEQQSYDTGGITHHATIPLGSGGRRFGLLNVADRGRERFEAEELALLQAVAFQIGGAIERMRLYAAEQRRAALYAALGEFSRALGTEAGSAGGAEELAARAVSLIPASFGWPCAALLAPLGDGWSVLGLAPPRAEQELGEPLTGAEGWPFHSAESGDSASVTGEAAAVWAKRLGLDGESGHTPASLLAAGVSLGGRTGLLVIGCDITGEQACPDREVLEALAEHIASVLEGAMLEEQRRELARWDERNRLARDLHDSVSQMLFSLSMTARGTEAMLTGIAPEEAMAAVREMQGLAQSALKEMRALILQLRPEGLEAGLGLALAAYGRQLGLRVELEPGGLGRLSRGMEEALWRIGQEALNNVCKHAGTKEARIQLQVRENEVILRVADRGPGLAEPRAAAPTGHSIGLSTMRERAESLGGRLRVSRANGGGTVVEAAIPLRKTREPEKEENR